MIILFPNWLTMLSRYHGRQGHRISPQTSRYALLLIIPFMCYLYGTHKDQEHTKDVVSGRRHEQQVIVKVMLPLINQSCQISITRTEVLQIQVVRWHVFHVAVKTILLDIFSTFEGLRVVLILNAIATTDTEQQNFNSRI